MSCLPVLDRSLVLARPLQVVSLLQQTVFSLHSGSFEEDLLGYCVHSYRLQEAKKSDLKSEKEENELFTLCLVFKQIFIQDFLISLCHYVKTCPTLIITRKRSLVMEFNVLTRSLTKVALMYLVNGATAQCAPAAACLLECQSSNAQDLLFRLKKALILEFCSKIIFSVAAEYLHICTRCKKLFAPGQKSVQLSLNATCEL